MTVRFDPKTGHVVKLFAAPRAQWFERDSSSGQLTKLRGFARSSGEQDPGSKTISREEFDALPGEAFTAKDLTERLTSGKPRRVRTSKKKPS